MAYLGFQFNLKEFDLLKLNIGLKLNKEILIVLFEKKNLKSNYIIGFTTHSKEKEALFIYLNKNFEFNKFIFLDDIKFRYSKISLGEKKIIDFEYNTFWFPVKEYKELYSILNPRMDKVDFKNSMLLLLNLFK